ncbi:MAG: penicillin acylase family protein [Pyrinomonadaceae bacterium]
MKKKSLLIWLLLLAFAPLGCYAQEPNLPRQEIKTVGLKSKVTIRRDDRGIPYIEAANDSDLYFAQGYATAQDRLWQMDLLRRAARGELSEIFGRQPTAAGTIVDEDKRWRKYGFARIAEQTLPLMTQELRAALASYARGVNAYIASLDEKSLPPEFKILQYRPRDWQPTDSIVIGKILADGLSTTWRFDLVKASLQSLPADKLNQLYNIANPDDVLLIGKDSAQTENGKRKTENGKSSVFNLSEAGFAELTKAENVRKNSLERVGLYAEDLAASNNWVISGKRTADGKPILANDPHLPASVPSVWYLVNLNSPNVNAAGASLPGAPGVILGHNAQIAWGATNVGPDVQDLYLEEFNAANQYQYKTPQGWQDAQIRREEIKVRKSPVSTDTETETLEVTQTRHGPIYFEDGGRRYALKWTAFDPNNNEFEAFFFLNRARNWDDFRAALKKYGGAMQNFVYADTAGNIGWYAAGRVPVRKTRNGSVPYDGTTDAGEWTGTVPFEELPNLYNPPENFIVTANQRIVGQSYKYQEIVRDFASPYRARRLYDLISANQKITVENVNEIQHDIFNIPLSRFAREVVKNKGASDETSKLLADWDGKMNADSKAALLVSEMQAVFSKRILDANLSAAQRAQFRSSMLSSFLDRLITEKPSNWLPKEFANYGDLLKACEKDARENLIKKLGADAAKWTWGEANKIRFNHPLASVPFIGGQFAIEPLPLNGAGNSPNVGSNVSMRLIATPGNWDATRHGIALGESGLPNSPHYKDQLDSWYKGISPVFPFSQPAVKKASKEAMVLIP